MKTRTAAAYYEIFDPRPAQNTRPNRLRVHPRVGEQLSSGSTSTVHQSDNNVLKRVTGPEMKTTLTELTFLTALKHPNIMRVHSLAFTAQSISFSMPKYNMNLEDYLIDRRDQSVLEPIVLECAIGLDYLHSKGIIHADLKPANIFVVIRETKLFGAIIGDFGLSRLESSPPTLHHIQTPIYRAPEVAIGSHVTPAIDLWSLGVIVAEMIGLKIRVNTNDATRYACEYYSLPHCENREQNKAQITAIRPEERLIRFYQRLGVSHKTPLVEIAGGCLCYEAGARYSASNVATLLNATYQQRAKNPIAEVGRIETHVLASSSKLPSDTLLTAAAGVEKVVTGQIPRMTDEEFIAAKKLASEKHGQVLL